MKSTVEGPILIAPSELIAARTHGQLVKEPMRERLGFLSGRCKSRTITLMSGLAFAAVAAGGATYDNSTITGNWVSFGHGSTAIQGNPTTATYGETFTAPSASVLDDWTFYLQQIPQSVGGLGTAQSFKFFVMGWNGNDATGPVLYQSGLQTVASGQNSYSAFTVHPDLTLTPGKQYIMFLNESGLNGTLDGTLELGGNGNIFGSPHALPLGGQFVYQYSGDDFSQVSSGAWQTWPVDCYAAYTADFSSPNGANGGNVPDGGCSMVLMSLSLGGLALVRRRLVTG